MTNSEYHKIYCECFNRHLTYEKYFPVKDFLYKIVRNFKETIGSDLDFMTDILSVFDLVIEHNKYDNLDRYLDFVINVHAPWFEVGEILKTIIFPEKMTKNKNWYYEVFGELCHHVNLRFDEEKFTDLRIEEIMKLYRKYHESIPCVGINGVNHDKLIYYEKFAPIIVGYFYQSDRDVKYLDEILKNFIDKHEEIYTKGYLSGICDLEHFRSKMGDEGEYDFFTHLVDNGISTESISIK